MTSTHGPNPLSLTFDGKDAVKIIIRYTPTGPTVTTQAIRGRALRSLPLGPGERSPLSVLELRDGAGATLFRRPFSPPGRAEIPGGRPMWVRLPRGYTEVRVVIVPHFRTAARLIALRGDASWLEHPLQGGL